MATAATCAAAVPVAELLVELANETPTPGSVLRRVAERRGRGVSHLLRWSRRSVAEVLRGFFREEAVMAPAVVVGPAVWGLSPDTPGSGLGALTYAMKHVASVGRPVGGSGAVPDAVLGRLRGRRAARYAPGAQVDGDPVRGRAGPGRASWPTARDRGAARGVGLRSPRHLRDLAPQPAGLGRRRSSTAGGARRSTRATRASWTRSSPTLPRYHQLDPDPARPARLRAARTPPRSSRPPLDQMAEAHRLMADGRVADRPMFFANIPSVLDPSLQASEPDHVFSLETLYTPYRLRGWMGRRATSPSAGSRSTPSGSSPASSSPSTTTGR